MSGSQVPTKNALDVAKIFLTYTAFAGDEQKTAVTLDMPVEDVQGLAVQEHWKDKLAQINKFGGDAKTVQVQINRAINFVQANRARALLDRVLTIMLAKAHEGDGSSLMEFLTTTGPKGSEFKTRALTDLVKALESAQQMTQRALGDTADERPPEASSEGGSSIALQVMAAMNASQDLGVSSIDLIKQQLAQECKPRE